MHILFDSSGRGSVALTQAGSAQGPWQSGLIGVSVMQVKAINPGKEKHAIDSSDRIVRHRDSEKKRMSSDNDQTNPPPAEFDFSAWPRNTLFHERRTGRERPPNMPNDAAADRPHSPTPRPRHPKKDRRRRIDPTTFDKQYSDDEMEFMNAVQRFKEQSGKAFPAYGDVLRIAVELGYRQCIDDSHPNSQDPDSAEPDPDPSSLSL
jgi:hypothetical protein